jgi:membrane protein YqaA with SNARE-associated domain
MPFGDFSSPLMALGSVFAIGFVSALLPLVNAEIAAALLGTIATRALVPQLVLALTAGHLLGKCGLYGLGRAADRLPEGRLLDRVHRAQRAVDEHERFGGSLLFTSALTGLPPYYVVTVACGVARFPFVPFVLVSAVGRVVRFGLVAAFPTAIKSLIG